MSLIVWCVSGIALWVLWRRSIETELGIKVASVLALTLWRPFLYADHLAGCGKTRGQTDLSTAWTHNLLIQHSRWGTDSSVPVFFRSLLVPGSSQLVNYPAPAAVPQVAGITLYPQAVLTLMALMLIAGGYGLTRRGDART